MARTLVRLSLPAAILGVLLAAGAQTLPTVDSIGVAPAPSLTRITLRGAGPLVPLAAAYGPATSPAELRIEFGPSRWSASTEAFGGEALLQGLRFETQANGRTELLLTMAEKVPFRIVRGEAGLIIDLLKFRRGGEGYAVEPEIEAALAAAGQAPVPLAGPSVIEGDGRVEIAARLGRRGTAAVFALDNPLRLVVDVFDAVYGGPTENRPLGRGGVAAMRVGQFMSGAPYTITRMVFDLSEPGPFYLPEAGDGFRIGFGLPSASAPADAAPVASEPAPKPASVQDDPVSPAAAAAAAPRPVQPPPAVAPPVQAPAKAETGASRTITDPQPKYTGERYSPKFKDADIRDVILWLGEEVGLNIVFNDEVKGTVTCSFDDIPWDQFLDIILKDKKLGKTLEGNVMRIAPMATLATEQAEEQKLLDAREQGGPLIARTYTLSYAKAAEVEPLIASKKSQRGEISIDARTNTLLLLDTKEKLELIEKLISVLDTATPQVVIEARIVEATSNFVRNLGIQWGTKAVSDPFYGNQTSLQFPNKVAVDGALIPEGTTTKGISGPLGGYAVNLPATSFSSAVGLSFANVLDTLRLDVALTAMETNGDGKIISTTQVTALNNKEAEVIQGRQIPVQTTANFTVTTQFFNAALQLKATPQITADGSIIMQLDIQNNAADFSNLVNGIPPITTQSAKTQVMVPDGGTTVIGGISRMEDSITRERVPFLHQIPILGALFKNFARTKTTRELLIFITPRILQ